MDKPIAEAVLYECAIALSAEWNLHYPDAVRMATVVLTAAQQQGQAVAFDRMLGSPAYPDARTDPFNALCTAPPSAPVGVAFNRCPDDGSLVNKQGYRLAYGGVPGCWRVKPEDFPAEALAQQPAAVDEARVVETIRKALHHSYGAGRTDYVNFTEALDFLATQHQEPTT